jgi:predicted DNA-binding transcriptional regulator AlpA
VPNQHRTLAVIAVPGRGRTDKRMPTTSRGATPPTVTHSPTVTITIHKPLWAIEDLARVLGVEVDSAREYTYRAEFPGAVRLGGRRNLWVPAEVIEWAYAQPRLTAQDRKRTPAAAEPAVTSKPYTRRDSAAVAA